MLVVVVAKLDLTDLLDLMDPVHLLDLLVVLDHPVVQVVVDHPVVVVEMVVLDHPVVAVSRDMGISKDPVSKIEIVTEIEDLEENGMVVGPVVEGDQNRRGKVIRAEIHFRQETV
jgi:hypothetical protein